jgi:hypothetical protein
LPLTEKLCFVQFCIPNPSRVGTGDRGGIPAITFVSICVRMEPILVAIRRSTARLNSGASGRQSRWSPVNSRAGTRRGRDVSGGRAMRRRPITAASRTPTHSSSEGSFTRAVSSIPSRVPPSCVTSAGARWCFSDPAWAAFLPWPESTDGRRKDSGRG